MPNWFYLWLWCGVIFTCWRSRLVHAFYLSVWPKTLDSKSSKILFRLHYANLPLTCHGQPPTPAAPLCTNHVSFEVPVIASSWPDIDLHTPVHLSLIHPPRPRLHVRARRLPVPSRAAAWQAANRAWQVARQCHGLTAESAACLHSFPPLCPLTWTPPLQTPSPLHPPSCWGNIMPDMGFFLFFTAKLFKGGLFSLLSAFVFNVRVRAEGER